MRQLRRDPGADRGVRPVSAAGRRVIIEADGGSRGNPGPAGYGALVKDAETGDLLAERKAALGIATNNVAEYTGLVEGLRAATELGASSAEVRMDSKLVVEQMSGRWKIKNAALQPLARQARDLAMQLDRVNYTWIPRAQNAHADRLANEAMDADGEESADPEPASGTQQAERGVPASWTGATGAPTRLLLVRHGQTPMSVDRRYSGRGDVELTDQGRWQAAAVAKRVAALLGARQDAAGPLPVVASPLSRAVDTAREVATLLGSEVRTHTGLTETDFGEWEGLTFAEASRRDPDVHRAWLGDTSVAPPGGESFDAVHQRVRRARDNIISEYGGGDVVVVSHVTPIKTVLRMGLAAGPELLFRLHLDLASLSIVEFYPDGNASVRLVNDTAHLDAP
ncbi:MAG: bifunctional RNase H/acid phosphatase [Actinophytocola sp.]|nr:bifunctional RNase H/acid phosphatase [Actinophytocola sp.]